MDYDYSRRGYLLPEGCKDLIDVNDVIQPTTSITKRGFVVTVRLPGLKSGDLEITVEGTTLRISVRQNGALFPYAKTIEVPGDYVLTKSRAVYLNGQLRILVPPK